MREDAAVTWTDRDDEVESLEALEEDAKRDDRGSAESGEEAAGGGLAYSPPERAPVRPGGTHEAIATGFDVPNEELLEDVLSALAGNPATEHLDLRVTVADGAVTLRGRVAGAADAEEAVGTVLSVSGVRRVEDELDTRAFG